LTDDGSICFPALSKIVDEIIENWDSLSKQFVVDVMPAKDVSLLVSDEKLNRLYKSDNKQSTTYIETKVPEMSIGDSNQFKTLLANSNHHPRSDDYKFAYISLCRRK